jgi:hypothetical protein
VVRVELRSAMPIGFTHPTTRPEAVIYEACAPASRAMRAVSSRR